MIRRPPRSTRVRSSAASDVYKRTALEKAGVQVEHIARVRLAPRRAAQQQGDRAIRLGLLGQVVEDDEHMLAVVHPVLADGRAGVGGEVLEARRVGRR